MKNLFRKISLIMPVIISTIILPATARAFNPADWKIIPKQWRVGNDNDDVSDIIVTGVNIFLSIVGILTLVYLVYGGVLYITAGGDAEKAASGKNAVIHAIIGIVIIAAAYIIFGFARGIGTGDTTDLFQR